MEERQEDEYLHSSGYSATIWTPERRELYQWFKDNAPSLAPAYKAAVRLLADPNFPARTHLISHIVRDICNRLPEFLVSVERDRIDYENELDSLAEIWPASIGLSTHDYVGDEQAEATESSYVRVPRAAAAAVSRLLDKHRKRQTYRDIVEDMLVIIAEADEYERAYLMPIVEEFRNTAKWFMERAHLRREPMAESSHDELVRKFKQFERITLSLIRGFFKTMDELNELLQQANARAD